MRKVLLFTALICLVATGAMADKLPAKKGGQPLATPMTKAFFEGFEGAFPPAGWTQTVTVPSNTWVQDGLNFAEGAYSAYIPWTAAAVQDERLAFDYLVEAGDYLMFWASGSQYWATNGNLTVTVNGDLVYDLLNDFTFYPGAFTWYQVAIDLAAYEGMTVTVEFVYAGTDGADQYIDAVDISEFTPPPPPPDVSFCDFLIDATGTGTFYGDTCDGVNLIESLGCEAYTEAGLEDYYEVRVPAGGSFTATVTNTADGALWVLGECLGIEGVFNCLGYADATLSGDPEVVSFTNTGASSMYVYLVVDSWGTGSCGTYELVFEGTGGAVATDDVSIDAVKALYR